MGKITVVIDTNVLVSALLNHEGTPAKVIDMMLDGKITAVINEHILSEYRNVLNRERFGLKRGDVDGLLAYIGKYSEICLPQASVSISKIIHEDDRKFLEAAIAGKADFLITGNLKHFQLPKAGKCKVVSPAEFIENINR